MLGTASQRGRGDVRPPAVAGTFYPGDATELRGEITGFLRDAERAGPVPKALIVPHAGYQYSGPVAASGYAMLEQVRETVKRVVLFGPSHRVPLRGLATMKADGFATPLGVVPIDRDSVEQALQLPQVQVLEQAHRQEHSLEVHLPFLQVSLAEFSLVPFVIGKASAAEVAGVLDLLWTNDETLVVVSSDLSHYHPYSIAQTIDRETSEMIEGGRWEQLSGERACGYCGIRGLLKVANERGLHVKAVDVRNSGDTSGSKGQVVGYGSYVVYSM